MSFNVGIVSNWITVMGFSWDCWSYCWFSYWFCIIQVRISILLNAFRFADVCLTDGALMMIFV